MDALNEALAQWSLWNNLYGAQRRLLRKERQVDGKIKRYHEKAASNPAARLLASGSLSEEGRRRLEQWLHESDPIAMKASIEAKLKAVYERRAQLQAEGAEQIEAIKRPWVSPRAGDLLVVSLRSDRSVAYGAIDSLRYSSPRE